MVGAITSDGSFIFRCPIPIGARKYVGHTELGLSLVCRYYRKRKNFYGNPLTSKHIGSPLFRKSRLSLVCKLGTKDLFSLYTNL